MTVTRASRGYERRSALLIAMLGCVIGRPTKAPADASLLDLHLRACTQEGATPLPCGEWANAIELTSGSDAQRQRMHCARWWGCGLVSRNAAQSRTGSPLYQPLAETFVAENTLRADPSPCVRPCTGGSQEPKTSSHARSTDISVSPLLQTKPSAPAVYAIVGPQLQILIEERCVLHTLSFQLTVEHPYAPVMKLLKTLFARGRGADGGKGVDKALNRRLIQVCKVPIAHERERGPILREACPVVRSL